MQVLGQSQVIYTWDNADRLSGITQGSSSVGFSYDSANRRTTLTLPNGVTVTYTYDNVRLNGVPDVVQGTRARELGSRARSFP